MCILYMHLYRQKFWGGLSNFWGGLSPPKPPPRTAPAHVRHTRANGPETPNWITFTNKCLCPWANTTSSYSDVDDLFLNTCR